MWKFLVVVSLVGSAVVRAEARLEPERSASLLGNERGAARALVEVSVGATISLIPTALLTLLAPLAGLPGLLLLSTIGALLSSAAVAVIHATMDGRGGLGFALPGGLAGQLVGVVLVLIGVFANVSALAFIGSIFMVVLPPLGAAIGLELRDGEQRRMGVTATRPPLFEGPLALVF